MSVIMTLILVTSMPTVRTPLEAMNAIAEVVTVAMDSLAMVYHSADDECSLSIVICLQWVYYYYCYVSYMSCIHDMSQ